MKSLRSTFVVESLFAERPILTYLKGFLLGLPVSAEIIDSIFLIICYLFFSPFYQV
jgi:hypothetical protein